MKGNRKLYITFIAFGVNAIGMQVFYPYLIIYVQNYLGFDNYVVLLGIVLIVASAFSVIMGRVVDRIGRIKVAIPAVCLMATGMAAMYFSRSFIATTLAGCVMMSGYLLSTSVLSALVRDYTPPQHEGEIQGVRMVFQVMIPMVVGPVLGSAAIKGSGMTYMELGEVKSVPTPLIFLIAAVVTIFSLIPLIALRKEEKR